MGTSEKTTLQATRVGLPRSVAEEENRGEKSQHSEPAPPPAAKSAARQPPAGARGKSTEAAPAASELPGASFLEGGLSPLGKGSWLASVFANSSIS